MPGGLMRPGPPQRAAAYQQPAWASPTWKLAARIESLSSAGAACTIITKQISTLTAGTSAAHPGRRCDGCTGRRGRQGPHPSARKIEVTRARYPLPEPRRTSPPLTLLRAGARGPPWLTAAARNARAHAGQHWSARRARAWIFFSPYHPASPSRRLSLPPFSLMRVRHHATND